MGKVYEATQKIKLDADAAVGYRIMCDFEKYPTWWKHVRTVNVLERDDRGVAVASGIYLLKLITVDGQDVKKIVLAR